MRASGSRLEKRVKTGFLGGCIVSITGRVDPAQGRGNSVLSPGPIAHLFDKRRYPLGFDMKDRKTIISSHIRRAGANPGDRAP